mmetsp:Transcript_15519/g.42865  ORF Transcript_15519/g.42865 Transcript_15519/m.42865 type:complete len:260 (+) Transcript_15519:566-1345(+)
MLARLPWASGNANFWVCRGSNAWLVGPMMICASPSKLPSSSDSATSASMHFNPAPGKGLSCCSLAILLPSLLASLFWASVSSRVVLPGGRSESETSAGNAGSGPWLDRLRMERIASLVTTRSPACSFLFVVTSAASPVNSVEGMRPSSDVCHIESVMCSSMISDDGTSLQNSSATAQLASDLVETKVSTGKATLFPNLDGMLKSPMHGIRPSEPLPPEPSSSQRTMCAPSAASPECKVRTERGKGRYTREGKIQTMEQA